LSHTFKAGYLPAEIQEPFSRLETALNAAQTEFTFFARESAPNRTTAHMVVVAGTSWNPGSGPGVYKRNAANDAWEFQGPYSAGSGGTVTQLTSKATGVTLSKPCGEITMNNAALAAGAVVSFTLTNTTIAATDLLVMNHVSGGTLGEYSLNAACASGSAVIYVKNTSAGALSEAIVIRFAVVKGATS
jgi:hypothetical protein